MTRQRRLPAAALSLALGASLSLAGCGFVIPVTPLAAAARQGNIEAIHRLARAGANVDEPSGVNNWTPLMHAVHKGQLRSVEALLAEGANPNAATPGGGTALMMAAGYGYDTLVRALLRAHADARLRNRKGQTALDFARHGVGDIDRWTYPREQTACVHLLEAAGTAR